MLASTHLRRSLAACAVLLLPLTGCEHGEGGVCQGTRDCEDGLVCDLTLDETRGVCRSPEDIDGGSDAGMVPDDTDPAPDPIDASIDGGAAGSGATDGGSQPIADAGTDSGFVNHEDAGSDGDGG